VKPPGWKPSLAVAVLAALAVSAGTLGNGFVNYDDNVVVAENPAVRDGGPGGLARLFVPEAGREYLPVRDLTYWLDHRLWGMDPAGYHLTQILLHALVTGLLVLFLVSHLAPGGSAPAKEREAPALLGRRSAVLLLAPLLFAVHPVHVEAVAWVTGRKDLLAAAFTLLALLSYGAWRRGRGRRSYGFSLLWTALALLSKTTAVAVPLLLWAGDRILWRRRSGKDPWAPAPHLALAAIAGAVALRAGSEAGMLQPLHGGGPVTHLLFVCRVLVHSLGKLLLPLDLHPEYGLDPAAASGAAGWGSLALVAVLLVLLFRGGRDRPAVLFGGVFFLVAYLPTSNLVPFQEAGADRYLYLPSAGFLVLAALGFAALERLLRRTLGDRPRPSRAARAVVPALAGTCLLLLGGRTIEANGHWRNAGTLWREVLAHNAGSATAHYNLGWSLLEEDRVEEAIPHLRAAVRIEPLHVRALVNLGYALARAGRPDEAVPYYRQAIRIDPGHASAYYNLGCARALMGDAEKAVHWLRRAGKRGIDLGPLLESDPDLDPIRQDPAFRRLLKQQRAGGSTRP
jgi:hypothetical protein